MRTCRSRPRSIRAGSSSGYFAATGTVLWAPRRFLRARRRARR
jgi:hypothetical protein